MSEQSKNIAWTIIEQLGGRQFTAMTGARNLSYDNTGTLSFKLPKFSGVKWNHVRIELTPADVYRVWFFRIWKMEIREQKVIDDVYCDQIRDIFEQETGLATRMPRIIGLERYGQP